MEIHRNAPAAAETGRPRRAAPGIAKGNLGTGGDVLGVGRPLKTEIARVHAANYGVYGARKVWLALNREGIAVARCTVERLLAEWVCPVPPEATRKTTIADPAAGRGLSRAASAVAPPGGAEDSACTCERRPGVSATFRA